MENSREGCDGAKKNEESPNSVTEAEPESNLAASRQTSRTPFTSLSQVDADLALARTLQEQERAYMMLRMNSGEGSDYGSSENGSYVYEDDVDDQNEEENAETDADEDAFDVHARVDAGDNNQATELDPSAFDSDEAYARALQEAEMAVHLMALAGINDWEAEDSEDHGSNSQDTWEEVDPDELSYEELLALGEVVGTESRGLSADMIASLPSVSYNAQSNQDGSTDQCVICRLDYEDGETLTVLSCKHSYHSECITNWLQINKVCPVCSAEVSTSESR
ncbi:PREDICTED: E3 ubiquitin ligase BIG BROTHER-related [Nelumbo nucifera]|uniref:E3 ubiquitin ligase BIG BROTHER-related n=1 Tax=Nelumbo nucifera TaxID=4432 RepID=A0A1U8A4H2_NELNU|nr:PREDICTED: E3 ubiquitin ligase BIG BROTHER-related [Nelumbo nucifera]